MNEEIARRERLRREVWYWWYTSRPGPIPPYPTGLNARKKNKLMRAAVRVLLVKLPAELCAIVWSFLKRDDSPALAWI